MEQKINPDLIAPVAPDLFLPPINRWLSLGGIVMLSGVVSAIAFTAFFEYRVTVKTPAQIRPEGELRMVETVRGGKIAEIAVKPNQKVQKGDIVAYIDDFALKQDREQLQSNLEATEAQIVQLQKLIDSKNKQIIAEKQQIQNEIAASKLELSLAQNNYQDSQIERDTALKTAQANFDLAQDELTRYQNLAQSGAIAVLQLKEKESAYRNAQAQLQKAIAQLNPNDDGIQIAQKNIKRANARGNAAIALLQQEQQTLLQEQIKLQEQLKSDRQKIRKIEAELNDLIIRTPVSGTIQELNLRNRGQVIAEGKAIATIAPSESSLIIKAAVATSEISLIEIGQSVRMRVSSCPYTDYGMLSAQVTAISPDVITQADSTAYEVTIQPQDTVLQQGTRQCTIQSGMDGRADIITEEETLLRYLIRKLKIRNS